MREARTCMHDSTKCEETFVKMQLGNRAFTKNFTPLHCVLPHLEWKKVQPGEETMNEVSLGKALQQ